MKVLHIVIALTLVMVGTAFAGQFGPPEPLADQGKASLGVGYWLDRDKMKQDGDRLGVKSNQYSLQGSYTFLKDWEVYGRVGSADMTVYSHDTHRRFSDSGEVFGGAGVKGVVYRTGNFAVGPFVEGNLYGDHKNVVNDQWDTSLGVSAQYKVRNVALYGGPFGYWHRADSGFSTGSQEEMKERHNLGVFLGMRVPVVQQKIFLTAEAQMRDKLGGGASINYKF